MCKSGISCNRQKCMYRHLSPAAISSFLGMENQISQAMNSWQIQPWLNPYQLQPWILPNSGMYQTRR